MSRPLRIQYPDAWYLLMNRGSCGVTVFRSKEDYQRFIDILHEAIELFALRISAYCLMSNHYHLLVQTPGANLARCMRHINGIYTQRFNATYGLNGPLFRGRYKAIVVGEGSYLMQLVRYIHKNPVRTDLVDSAEQYAWSSHQGYLSKAKSWDWLHKQFILSILSEDPKQQLRQYRSFMAEDDHESLLQTMSLKKLPSMLGDSEFIEMIKCKFKHKRHIEVPESKRLAPDAARIIVAVSDLYGVDKTQLFRSKRGTFNEARSMAVYLLRQLRGEPLTTLGEAFDIDNYSTVSSIIERFKVHLQSDRQLSRRVESVRNLLMRQE